MKGSFLHNIIMAATLVKTLRQRGYHVQLEYPVRRGQRPPAIDICVQVNTLLLAIEIECGVQRIPNDFAKAEALRPDLYLIVLPNARLARSARFVIRQLTKNSPLKAAGTIQVMTFGAALQWIDNNCPSLFAPAAINDI